jgi:hypothetical protein
LVCKLQESFTGVINKESSQGEHSFDALDDISSGSDLTEAASINLNVEDIDRLPNGKIHRRWSSDSMYTASIHSLLKSNLQSLGTCETRSLTDSEYTDNQASTMTSLIGKDIYVTAPFWPQIDCYNAFKSIHRLTSKLDASIHIMRQLSANSMIDMMIYHLPSYKTNHDLRQSAIRQMFKLPAFYNAILFMVGGFMFVLGECTSANSTSTMQNIYLAGSSLYFCGSVGIIFEAWMTVSNAWNFLQDSRMELHAMAFSMGAGIDFVHERNVRKCMICEHS